MAAGIFFGFKILVSELKCAFALSRLMKPSAFAFGPKMRMSWCNAMPSTGIAARISASVGRATSAIWLVHQRPCPGDITSE